MFNVFKIRYEYYYCGILSLDVRDCNLNCAFCFTDKSIPRTYSNSDLNSLIPEESKEGPLLLQWKGPQNIIIPTNSQDLAKFLCEFSDKNGYSKIRLTGGEPTYHLKELLDFLAYFDEFRTNQKFILETNGITIGIHPDKAVIFEKYSPWLYVRLSLKSPNKQIYNRICQCKNDKNFQYSRTAALTLRQMRFSKNYHIVFVWDVIQQSDLPEIKEDYLDAGIDIEYETIYYYPHVIQNIQNAGCEDLFLQ